MSVYELLTPVKNWTDLDVKSCKGGEYYCSKPAEKFTSSPIVLTPEQIVSGTLGFVSSGIATFVVSMPPGADIDAYFQSTNPVSNPKVFYVSMYSANGTTTTVNPGTGVGTYSGALPIVIDPNVPRFLTYVREPGGWVIYF